MTNLNSKIVAYLTINNISFTSDDYMTVQPGEQAEEVLRWNVEKLGIQPTEEVLNNAYIQYQIKEIKQQNKAKASSLLSETDWTAIPTIADSQYSNPCLMNQSDFLNYRNQLRAIAINPPETLVTNWPVKPDAIWSK